MKKIDEGIFLIDSGIKGPTLSIIAGVHGNEIGGIISLNKFSKKVKLKKGKIYVIYGNIKAIQNKVRQIDVNLNRIFIKENLLSNQEKESYEYERMKIIKKYLSKSEICLDLHSSPIKNSEPFIICERNSFEIIRKFPFEKICFGFSIIEPGGTDYFMNTNGKIGICIESGYHLNIKSVYFSYISIINILNYFSMIKNHNIFFKEQKKTYFQANYFYTTKTNSFKIVKIFNDFEKIKKGQLIGIDGNNKIYAKNNFFILFARDRNKIGVEGFIGVEKI